jgi:spermidine synthase
LAGRENKQKILSSSLIKLLQQGRAVSIMQRNPELEQSIRDAKFYLEEAQSACVTSNYPIDSVAWAGRTTYCSELVIAKNEEYGNMLITDKELQSTQVDEVIYHEHLVHPSILAYRTLYGDKPLRILVLGVS